MRNPTSYQYVAQFACLQADCPDTCCQGWAMPSDAHQRAMYAQKAPQLLASLDEEGNFKQQSPGGFCVEFKGGICGIHATQGAEMLGDSCHFYPRVMRRLGEQVRVAAQLSCPETLRLLLTLEQPFALATTPMERLPLRLRDATPETLNGEQAAEIVDFFIGAAGDATSDLPTTLRRLVAYAQFAPPLNHWQDWLALDTLLPPPRAQPTNPHMLLYALCLQIATAPRIARPRLDAVVASMEAALGCRMDWQSRVIDSAPDAAARYETLRAQWHAHAEPVLTPVLRRWLQAQLALAAFPFGGAFAGDRAEAMRLLAVRFATVRLALMCAFAPAMETPQLPREIDVMQSLARFIDHVADAELVRLIYRDAGWSDLAGLSGLLET
ncbi:MAG: hypothetical protein ACKVOE_07675 [Rickettsiales bacterium]